MKVVVAGASGFLGVPLCARLLAEGHSVSALSRDPDAAAQLLPSVRCLRWDGRSLGDWAAAVGEADGVVNLAGASVGERRWTAAYKQEIRSSRIEATRALAAALGGSHRPGRVLVSASGVGYYGDTGDAEVSEDTPAGSDFLAEVCQAWEGEAHRAAAAGVRVVAVRTGIVLGAGGGALARMVTPFKLLVGGPIGSGRQWMPWIHRDDEIALLVFALTTAAARGPMNATAPSPVRMREFAQALGRALSRPAFARVPGFMLRLAVGEFAQALLGGQRALPRAACRWGFQFRYQTLEQALAAIFPRSR
ncbi:MAG TPA: TIGR01777 family oxidoreductase [Polyangia bacterium]|nr:TIGR01777 family oxidoreductase [Polyangia bacterium]